MQSPTVEQQRWSRWPWLVAACAIGAALAMMPPLLAVSWWLGLVAIGLAVIDPVWPVALAVLSVPFQQLIILPGGLSFTQFCLGLVALRLLWHTRRRLPSLGLAGIALAIFLWTLALSAALTPLSRSEGLKETLRWGTVLLVYVAAVGVLHDPMRAQWRRNVLIACLLAAPAATGLIGIGQYLTGSGPEGFVIGGGRVRAYGTIGQPNSFAGYLNQAWPLAAGMGLALIEDRRWRSARWWLVAGAITLASVSLIGGLLASFSRGGWLGALTGAVVLGIAFTARYGRRIGGRLVTTGLLAGLTGLLLLNSGLVPAAFSNRFASILANLRLFDARGADITPDNFAVVERMAHLQAAWHMLQERPLFGIGPGNFSIAYERLVYSGQTPTWIKPWYTSRGHAHNYYLHIAAESGLIGALGYLFFLGSVWYIAIVAVRQARDWLTRGIALGGIGVVGALSGHNVFENLHVLNMGVQFGTVIALLATIAAGQTSRPHGEETL